MKCTGIFKVNSKEHTHTHTHTHKNIENIEQSAQSNLICIIHLDHWLDSYTFDSVSLSGNTAVLSHTHFKTTLL